MPQPHEQKLHEVVNSLTAESFRSLVAARTAETSRRPPSASPAPPPRVSLSRSRRLTADFGLPLSSRESSESCGLGTFGDSSMSSSRDAPSAQGSLLKYDARESLAGKLDQGLTDPGDRCHPLR